MTEDTSRERERFNAYDAFRQLGWRIDEVYDVLDKFNARLRSNTARISRLKVLVETQALPEGEEELEEEREERRQFTERDLHRLSVEQIRDLLNR